MYLYVPVKCDVPVCKLYGLPKTHKPGVPLRPILSAVTCHNYNLAKFLLPLLSPLSSSEYTVSDVFSFTKEIQQRVDVERKLMISLDIESLFTNVPVAETIDIIKVVYYLKSSIVMILRRSFSWPLKIH